MVFGFWVDIEGVEDGFCECVYVLEFFDGVEVCDVYLLVDCVELIFDYFDCY